MNDKSLPTVGKLYRLKPEKRFSALGRILDGMYGCALVLQVTQDETTSMWAHVTLLLPAYGAIGTTFYNRDMGYPSENTGWSHWWEEVTNEIG